MRTLTNKHIESIKGKRVPARIVACCDPYHAKLHYNGEKVIESDMGTPVQWVIGEYDSIEEAREALWKTRIETWTG